MGISGLLPALKSIHRNQHVKHWAGRTVAVDAYGWLHRGTVSCAIDLALGKPTTKYVEFAMGRVRMLMHYGVIPYIVFDGDFLPSKAGEEAGRAKRREASREAGLKLLRQGNASQAHLELQKAVDVTPQMARHFIDALKLAGVKYVVAPYEADAQMYYLEHKEIVDAIISEDSDLLVFGCKNLITKLGQFGECVHICRDDFPRCRELSLAGWTDMEFRCMAILSGCDYLESIPRMGLKTAHRLVRKHKDINKILRILRFDGNFSIPATYMDGFRQADLTFLHQRVFCPILQKMVMCTPPEKELTDEDLIFIGPEIDEKLAQGVANGDLDPMSKQPLRGSLPEITSNVKNPSFFAPSYALPQTPVKPSHSIQRFFKPQPPNRETRAPLEEREQNKVISNASSSTGCTQEFEALLSDAIIPQAMMQMKRTSEIANEEVQPVKKAKLTNGSDASPPKPELEERSKFFTTPKHRQARRGLDTDPKSSAKRPVPKSPPKQNMGVQKPSPTARNVPSPGKENLPPQSSSTVVKALETFEKVVSESTTPSKIDANTINVTVDFAEDVDVKHDEEKLGQSDGIMQKIAQGWRERYAFVSPAASSKPPCALEKAPSRSGNTSSTPKLTPLQRIGSNAMNRSKTSTAPPLLRSVQRAVPATSPSAHRLIADSPLKIPRPLSIADQAFSVGPKAAIALDKFRYAPSGR
ncbi:PIN domain-like protein [Peziza echinospora]|nr:PIN domain-like protein [Peziza echinospora]